MATTDKTITILATIFLATIGCSNLLPVPAIKPVKTLQVVKEVVPFLKLPYKSTLQVRAISISGKIKDEGTAVVLRCKKGSPIVLITAYHVVESSDLRKDVILSVGSNQDNTMKLVRILKRNSALDLAILKGLSKEKKDCSSIRISKTHPRIGDSLWVIGSPMQVERNISKGILSAVVKSRGVFVYRSDAAVFFGNSGGGAFNSQGNLIGIVKSIQGYFLKTNTGLLRVRGIVNGGSFITPLSSIQLFSKGLKELQ